MTNEDTAWEQFSKADAANIGDASAVGMLQAIMAELNSIKEDTARLEQKIDGGAGEPPMDAGMPPMDEGAPAEMPPMDAGMPPADAEGSLAGEGVIPAPPMDAGAADMGMADLLGAMSDGGANDQTLAALQDALSQVSDPEAIAKLADIIKEYVAGHYQAPVEEPVPEIPPEIPPEVVVEALVGEGAPMEEPVSDVPPEVMDTLLRSEDAQVEEIEKACDEKAEPMAESPAAPVEEPGAKAPEESAPAGESAPAETVAASDEESEPEPAIQINLFLGAKMGDIIDENAKKGLTNEDDLPTDSFKVCDPEPVKRSIDDLINQNMRKQSGIDGKRYKITKSANELAAEEFQSIQKSIGSFNAVKDMRVGDILTTMQGLGKRGMTSIEKSYEPLIDEMVKYCDNNISPLYTEPIFRKFGLDLGKLYEPMDMAPFEKARRPVQNEEASRLKATGNEANKRVDESALAQLDPALAARWKAAVPNLGQIFNENNQLAKEFNTEQFPLELARQLGYYSEGRPLMSIDDILADMEGAGYAIDDQYRPKTFDEFVGDFGPQMFARTIGLDPNADDYDEEKIKRAYNLLNEIEPMVTGAGDSFDKIADQRFASLADEAKIRQAIRMLAGKTGVYADDDVDITTPGDKYSEENPLMQKRFADDIIKTRARMKDLADNGGQLTVGGESIDPAKVYELLTNPNMKDRSKLSVPGEILPGVFASKLSRGMALGDGLYNMSKDNIPKLWDYLSANYPDLANNSDVKAKYDALLNSYDVKTPEGKPDFKGTSDALKGLTDQMGALTAYGGDTVARNIFGKDGLGIKNGIFKQGNELDKIFQFKDYKPALADDVRTDVDNWMASRYAPKDEYAAMDTIEARSKPLADSFKGKDQPHPQSRAATDVGAEQSMNTPGFRAYDAAYTPLWTSVHDMGDVSAISDLNADGNFKGSAKDIMTAIDNGRKNRKKTP